MNLVTSNYLLALAEQTNIPQLKSFYRLRADSSVVRKNWCSKCKLSLSETGSLNCQTISLAPQSLYGQKLYEKLKQKTHLTQAQRKLLKKSKSFQQKLIKVCNACRTVTKTPLLKSSKPNHIVKKIPVTSVKKSHKAKRHIDFVIDTDGETPKKKKKKKKLNSSIIDITQSPVPEKNNNKIVELKMEIINKEKDISEGALSIKRKKKMKKKLSALKNCIDNLNKEKTSAKALLDKFLNSL